MTQLKDTRLEPKTGDGPLFSYRSGEISIDVGAPVFEINSKKVRATLASFTTHDVIQLKWGVSEHSFSGPVTGENDLSLRVIYRVADGDPVIRFRYELSCRDLRTMTKSSGRDSLEYAGVDLTDSSWAKEVRFSEFRDSVHAFCLDERTLGEPEFDNRIAVMGPMLAWGNGSTSALLAYEHGSQVPDAFVQFSLTRPRRITVNAVKGNYFAGEGIGGSTAFQSIWFQVAAVAGEEQQLAAAYRRFVLRHMSQNAESRKPYIFYNTWNFQERNKHWNGRPYLESMNEERMLAEVSVAHRMGIEVFVIDTGWFDRTGDWEPNKERFPRGLAPVKRALDERGMKLGVWFDNAAALSSNAFTSHTDCVISHNGISADPQEIWETERSHRMCLVSRYREAFADSLIRMAREEGVSYFKWDAIGQYGCDAPGHDHGTVDTNLQDRADCYAFRQVTAMTYIVNRLCAAFPESIVDFDITEGGRSVGLAFLSAGKYFLINNGPYFQNYDAPTPPPPSNANLFFWPGPARGWICRTPLDLDKWLPSVLYLTHYFPDDPIENQLICVASLVLGQNGIWGDLLAVSDGGVERIGQWLAVYKRVREDVTLATAIRTGAIGGSPEVHEKINPATGRGVVCLFASAAGKYTYVTRNAVAQGMTATEGLTVVLDRAGHAVLTATFDKPSAHIVFFQTD